jgi:hypothetical protein
VSNCGRSLELCYCGFRWCCGVAVCHEGDWCGSGRPVQRCTSRRSCRREQGEHDACHNINRWDGVANSQWRVEILILVRGAIEIACVACVLNSIAFGFPDGAVLRPGRWCAGVARCILSQACSTSLFGSIPISIDLMVGNNVFNSHSNSRLQCCMSQVQSHTLVSMVQWSAFAFKSRNRREYFTVSIREDTALWHETLHVDLWRNRFLTVI